MLAPSIFATNVITIYLTSDTVGQVIVLGLAVFSLIAWTIMLGKHFELKRLRYLNGLFEQKLRDERSLLDLPESYRDRRTIPYADLFADAVESYWRAAAIGKENTYLVGSNGFDVIAQLNHKAIFIRLLLCRVKSL